MFLTINRSVILACSLVASFGIASLLSGDWSPWVGSFLGVLVALLLLLSREHLGLGQNWHSPWRWFIVLLIMYGITIPWAGDHYAALRTWVYWFIGAAFFVSSQSLDRENRNKVLHWLVWLGGLASVWAIAQFIRSEGLDRAGGFLENANAFGGYVILLLPLALGCIAGTHGWRRWACISAACGLAIALVLSFSVTGAVALFAAGIVAMYTGSSALRRRWLKLFFGALLLVVVCVIGIRLLRTQNFSDAWRLDKVITTTHFQSSFTQRWQFNAVALAMVWQHPLTGIGLGNYQQTFTQYAASRLEQPRYTHNAYLEILAEAGIVGFVVSILFFWHLGKAVFRSYIANTTDRVLLGGAAIGLLASTIHALVDFSWHFPAVWVGFWIIAGLMVRGNPEVQHNAKVRTFQIILLVMCVLVVVRGLGIVLSYLPFQRADRQVDAEQFVEAIDNFQEGLRWDPDPTRMTKLATVLWLARPKGNLSLAKAELWSKRAMRWSSINYATYQNLARIAVTAQDTARAKQMYARMVEIDRHFHPDATAEYITFLRRNSENSEADRLTTEAEAAYENILGPDESLFGKN